MRFDLAGVASTTVLRRLIVSYLSSSLLGAMVLGMGGRLIMRIIAHMGAVPSGATVEGSLEVIAFGGLVGLVTGFLYTFIVMVLPRPMFFKGILVGLLLYGALLVLPIDSKLAARGFSDIIIPVHLLFGGLCVFFGMILVPFNAWVIRYFSR